MAITSFADLKRAARQNVTILKTPAGFTGTATDWNTIHFDGGNPPAYVPPNNPTAGVLVTQAVAGFPRINPFGAGNKGYVAQVASGVAGASGRIRLIDMLWYASFYSQGADVTLLGQPSIAARVPNGDYSNVAAWLTLTSTVAANPVTIEITYTNQDGVSGQVSPNPLVLGATTRVRRTFRIPLVSGDTGVQKIDRVREISAPQGTVNFDLFLARTLWTASHDAAKPETSYSLIHAMPEIFQDSALAMIISPPVALVNTPRCIDLVIVNG